MKKGTGQHFLRLFQMKKSLEINGIVLKDVLKEGICYCPNYFDV